MNEDSSYSFVPVGDDIDVGDTLVYSIDGLPSWASFSTSNGTLLGVPDNSHVGVYSDIIITITDSNGEFSTLPTFNITVINTNDAPVISGTPNSSIDEDTAYSFTPTTIDDDGDALTYSITGLPAWASFATSNGEITGTPDKDDIGSYTDIQITVTDGNGGSDSLAVFGIDVIFVNDAPTISGTPDSEIVELTTYTFVPQSFDEENDNLVFEINDLPSWASFSTSNGILVGTPANADVGQYNDIVISVFDGTNTTQLPTFNILVSLANIAPVISGTANATINEDSVYSFLTIYDENGDSVILVK